MQALPTKDIMKLNVMGRKLDVPWPVLTSVRGTRLEEMFNGSAGVTRDDEGRFYLPFNPACFQILIDNLARRTFGPGGKRPTPTPLILPKSESHLQPAWDHMLKLLGFTGEAVATQFPAAPAVPSFREFDSVCSPLQVGDTKGTVFNTAIFAGNRGCAVATTSTGNGVGEVFAKVRLLCKKWGGDDDHLPFLGVTAGADHAAGAAVCEANLFGWTPRYCLIAGSREAYPDAIYDTGAAPHIEGYLSDRAAYRLQINETCLVRLAADEGLVTVWIASSQRQYTLTLPNNGPWYFCVCLSGPNDKAELLPVNDGDKQRFSPRQS